MNTVFTPALPVNEPVLGYAPGSPERATLRKALDDTAARVEEIPLVIGGRRVPTGHLADAVMPHAHRHVLARAHLAAESDVQAAIDAAVAARPAWSRLPWEQRAAIFSKAADLLAGPWRARLNAATMLGQSKTAHQAEIDSACELADFWRFNVAYMHRIYSDQPLCSPGVWNHVDYRPLEGFVYAPTPFNFTAIAGNLPTAPALMGNTVVWKPAATAMLSAHCILELLEAAGLPPGVVNMVNGDGAMVARQALGDARLGGLHFTGSTAVFNQMLGTIAGNAGHYHAYPRVVGETGGKNFTLAHPSADVDALATAIIRGAFEYQGQKCSATSRIYVPQSLWPALRERLADTIAALRMGDVRDFANFMGAVIDERAFGRLSAVIAGARAGEGGARVLAGGTVDRSEGYYVRPTLLQTDDAASPLLRDEYFGPIITAFVFPDNALDDVLARIAADSRYALTGAIFARDRAAIVALSDALRDVAGNFYINDKSTGAVVGQQPFGGARASGTNDKAGSVWNLIRWVSPRAIKESFVSPTHYAYPFMQGDGRA